MLLFQLLREMTSEERRRVLLVRNRYSNQRLHLLTQLVKVAFACKCMMLLINLPRLFTETPKLFSFVGAVISLGATFYSYTTISEKRTLKQVVSSGNFRSAVAFAYIAEALFENENPDILSLQALIALVFYGDICFELFDRSTIMMFTAAKIVLLLIICPFLSVVGVTLRSVGFSWLLELLMKYAFKTLHQSIIATDKTNQTIAKNKVLSDNMTCSIFILNYSPELEIEYANALAIQLAHKLSNFSKKSEAIDSPETYGMNEMSGRFEGHNPNQDTMLSSQTRTSPNKSDSSDSAPLKNAPSFVVSDTPSEEGQRFEQYMSLPKSNHLVKVLTDIVSNMQEQGEELTGVTLLDDSTSYQVSIRVIEWAPDKKLMVEIRKDPRVYSVMARESIKVIRRCAIYMEHKCKSLSTLLDKNKNKNDPFIEKTKASISLLKNQLAEKSVITASFMNVLELGCTEECNNKLVLFDLGSAERLFKSLGVFVSTINQSRKNSVSISITNPLTKGCLMDVNALNTFLQSLLSFSFSLNSGNKFSLKMSAKKANESNYYLEFFYEGNTTEAFCSEVFTNLFNDTVNALDEELISKYPSLGMAITSMFFLKRHLQMKCKIFGGQFGSNGFTRQTTNTGSLQLGRTNSMRTNQTTSFAHLANGAGMGSIQLGATQSSVEQTDGNNFSSGQIGYSTCTLRFTITFSKADLRFGDHIEKKYNKVIYEDNHLTSTQDEIHKAAVLECDLGVMVEEWEKTETLDKHMQTYSALDESRTRTIDKKDAMSIQSGSQSGYHPLGSKMVATYASQDRSLPGLNLPDYRANPLEYLSLASEPELTAINTIVLELANTQLSSVGAQNMNPKSSPMMLTNSLTPVPRAGAAENRSPGIYSPHSSSTSPRYKRVISISPRIRKMSKNLIGDSTPRIITEVAEPDLPDVSERKMSEENGTVPYKSITELHEISVNHKKSDLVISPPTIPEVTSPVPEDKSAQSPSEIKDKVYSLPSVSDLRTAIVPQSTSKNGSQKRILTPMPSMPVKSTTFIIGEEEQRTPKLLGSTSALPGIPLTNNLSMESESKATLSNMDAMEHDELGGLNSQRDLTAGPHNRYVEKTISQGEQTPHRTFGDGNLTIGKADFAPVGAMITTSSQKNIQKKPIVNLTGSSVLENLRLIEEPGRLGVNNLQDAGAGGFKVSAQGSQNPSPRNTARSPSGNPVSRKNSDMASSGDPGSFREAFSNVPITTAARGDGSSNHKRNYSLSILTTAAATLQKHTDDTTSAGAIAIADEVLEPSRDMEEDQQSSADESRDKVLEMPFQDDFSGLNSAFWTPISGRGKLGSTPLPVRRDNFLELVKDAKGRTEKTYRKVFDHELSKSATNSLSPSLVMRSVKATGKKAFDDSLIDYRSCEEFRIFETVSEKLLDIVFSEAIKQGFFGMFNPPVELEYMSGVIRTTAPRGKNTTPDVAQIMSVCVTQQQETRKDILEHMYSRRRQTWILDIESQIKANKVPLILIVDDTDSDRMIIEEMILEEYPDAKIDHASNGLEAFENVQKKYMNRVRYDLVFMDMNMAEHDGTAGISMIRGFERRNKIQRMCNICAVSGDEFEETQADEEQIMFKVRKPLHFELLKRILKKVLVSIGSPLV